MTAPYVIAQVATQQGPQMQGLHEGELVPADVSEQWIAHHLRKKMIEEVGGVQEVGGAALTLPPAPAAKEEPPRGEELPGGASTPPVAPPPESGAGSSKQAWVEYAAARGMDRNEAAAMSRDDLIAALREG